ncbi:phytanoyl-CoA dioxygenase family protein [bacterium]|nr:phytanoyl-CoA dioxygenase family protein [bacterium]
MSVELDNLKSNGVHLFGSLLDKKEITALYQAMIESRDFGQSLFLSEADYRSQATHFKANPTPDFNFLNTFEESLNLVEKNPTITRVLSELLGDDYEVVIKKAICGVPSQWLPEWIKTAIHDVNVANLGPYIKPEFRDITYFRGIDFHQDIIDWPQGATDLDPSTFFTLYVYLHDVDQYDSPLHILPNSHQFGATLFPHQLTEQSDKQWQYKDDRGRAMAVEDKALVGGPGFVGLWHNCLLHGTQPVQHESERFRLSLRYLIGKSKKQKAATGIDVINNTIDGELSPIRTRNDLDQQGRAQLRGNVINQSDSSHE